MPTIEDSVRHQIERMSRRNKGRPKTSKKQSGRRGGASGAKYCRCLAKVAKAQSPSCLRSKKWKKGCYNPYAVCSRVRPSGARSRCHYDMSDRKLVGAMAALHGKTELDYLDMALEEISRMKKSSR